MNYWHAKPFFLARTLMVGIDLSQERMYFAYHYTQSNCKMQHLKQPSRGIQMGGGIGGKYIYFPPQG